MTSMGLKEKFNQSPLIKHYQRIAWASPLVIIAISIFISIYFSSWDHFSRAGSLIVVIGIFIAIKDISGDIYEISKRDYFTMSEFFEIGDIGKFDKDEINEFVEKSRSVEKTKEENIKFSRYASRRFRRMEAALLTGGTIIWGYGDLILNLIWNFKA